MILASEPIRDDLMTFVALAVGSAIAKNRHESQSRSRAARIGRAIYDTLDADREHFVVLALNQKNRLIGYKYVSTGTLTASLVREKFAGLV
jgi:DNA repair protein RadC